MAFCHRTMVMAAVSLLLTTAMAEAQQSDAPGWSVYVQENPTQCWVISTPISTFATRDGEDVSDAINRDEVIWFVSFWPGDARLGEVSYTGGYQFAADSVVTLEIGDASFELFTDGPMAWAGSPREDARITEAMRAGAQAVLTATSTRGTQVADTFTLSGFTAAIEDAEARCSQ